jgi:SAM-dependent methyltransferase
MTAAFDSVAARYDAQWTNTAIGRAQRNQVWREIDRVFRAGDRVLDFGCGTGEDAAHLASRGVIVHAIDPSPAMVREASRRPGFTSEVGSVPTGRYDGLLSNFGALNCVEDLRGLAARIADVVRPGGCAALCLMSRFCMWEPLRRANGSAPSSLGIRVYYPSIAEIRRAFAEFDCVRWIGIGLFVPPSYVKMPRWLVTVAAGLDRVLARLPMLRAMADHRLLILVRK